MDGDDVCGFVEAFTATELPHENDWDVRFYSIVISHVHTCPLIHTHTFYHWSFTYFLLTK